jgi:hypothetical protein
MSKDAPDRPQDRSEDQQERLNRQMMELLNELRVAMPGVQVLFGFLLTVPFQQRFQRVTEFQETVYFVTLIAAATATAFLIHIGTGQMLVGLGALAIAMNGAVLLVTDVLFEASTVTVTLVVLASLYLTLWFGFPLGRRMQK